MSEIDSLAGETRSSVRELAGPPSPTASPPASATSAAREEERRSESRSLLKRIFSYGAVSSATVGAMFLLHIAAGRFLGVEDYGRFSFALAFAFMLMPLLDPGLYYLLIREVARDRTLAQDYLAHALTWKLVAGPPFLIIIVLGTWLMHGSPHTVYAVGLIGLATILLSAKDALRPTLLAHERFDLDALSLTIERVSLLVAGGIVLLMGYGLIAFCAVFVVVRVLDLWVIRNMVRRMVPVGFGRNAQALRSIVMAALPIGAFYITLNIYNYVDAVMLSSIRGNEEVGWYSAAYKLYEGPALLPAAIGTVFMPRLSRLFVENSEQFRHTLRQGIGLVAAAAVAVTVVGILAAEWLVSLTYGAAFLNAVVALRVLLIGLIFAFAINFLQTVMISVGRQWIILLVAIGGLVANVGLNAFLIPAWGYRGAAAATVIVEACVFGALVVYVWPMIFASSRRGPRTETPA